MIKITDVHVIATRNHEKSSYSNTISAKKMLSKQNMSINQLQNLSNVMESRV